MRTRVATLLAFFLAFAAGCASEPVPGRGPDAELARQPEAPADETPSDSAAADEDETPELAKAPAKAAEDDAPKALGPPDDAGGGDSRLGDFARERTLEEQERQALAKNYLATGRNLFQQLRYREAAANLNRASALDPNNLEAVRLRDRVMWILGDRRAEYRDAVRTMVDERLAKIDQARVEMERVFHEGEMLMKRQRYDRAQERFQRVLEAIRWFPYDIDREGLRAKAQARIAEARKRLRASLPSPRRLAPRASATRPSSRSTRTRARPSRSRCTTR